MNDLEYRQSLARRAAAIRAMMDIPFFNEVWDDIERAAVNACISAGPNEDEKTIAYAAEARAIRKFRSRLNLILEEAKVVKN